MSGTSDKKRSHEGNEEGEKEKIETNNKNEENSSVEVHMADETNDEMNATNPFLMLRMNSTAAISREVSVEKSLQTETQSMYADSGIDTIENEEPENVQAVDSSNDAAQIKRIVQRVWKISTSQSENDVYVESVKKLIGEFSAKSLLDENELINTLNLQLMVQRVLAISTSQSENDVYIESVAKLIGEFSAKSWLDENELINTLNLLLMEIMTNLSKSNGRMLISPQVNQDSLSCSPSVERNMLKMGSGIAASDSPFSDVYQILDGSLELRLYNYLLACYSRVCNEQRNENLNGKLKNCLQELFAQVFACMVLLLQGVFTGEKNEKVQNLLLRAFLSETLPGSFTYDFVEFVLSFYATDFEDIFSCVFNGIIKASNVCSLTSESFRDPLRLLFNLCDLKMSNSNQRPFCNLLVKRADWIPESITKAAGREFIKLSALGPLFSMSAFSEGNLKFVEQYFPSEDISDDIAKLVYGTIRHRLSLLRRGLHQVLKSILVNSDSRELAVQYLSVVVSLNNKKSAMHPDDSVLASDGCILNFLAVLYELSSKVTLDRINPNYPFHLQTRVKVDQESRLTLHPEDLKAYVSSFDTKFDPKFPTECFFLTIHCQHIGLLPAFHRHMRRLQMLHDLERQVTTLEESEPQWRSHPVMGPHNRFSLKQFKTGVRKLKKSRYCAEAVLFDDSLLSQALLFATKQLEMVIRIAYPEESKYCSLTEVPRLFGAMPEFYVEDVLDLVIFILQNVPETLLQMSSESLCRNILALACNFNFFKNPFLSAKIVKVLFYCTPQVQPAAIRLYRTFMDDPLSCDRLFPSLVKFYSDVESTGSQTEFLDKFTIRYHIQVIFKSMWQSPVHRSIIIEYCRNGGPEFNRFVNMLINDTTYLLDESLEGLKRIHEIQVLLADNKAWAQLSREDQRDRQSQIQLDERIVPSWLQSARVIVDMFDYMTIDIKEPFFLNELGDRLAAMLNYNLVQLCGSKCRNLRVENPKRFNWEPRNLLNQLTEIYLHLDSDEFAEAIARDERSYSKELFDDVINRIQRSNIKPMSSVEQFKLLAERVNNIWKENLRAEEICGEVPEEFQDLLMGTLMKDPVKLPSGHIVDRGSITRHMLNTSTNPFTRQSMSESDLVPQEELKKKIAAWMKEKMGK